MEPFKVYPAGTPVPPVPAGLYLVPIVSAAAGAKAPIATPAPVNSITFTLNGTPVTVQNPDPVMTLNEFIRSQPNMTGTKKACAEGGCGACTVQIEYYDSAVNTQVMRSINSCLRPLCGVNGMSVTTIEALGSLSKGFSEVQTRLADGNGSQCGYCSPGWVVHMYNLLQTNSAPTQQQIEDHFDGNLCRCTGYRPILSAFKTFAVDYPSTAPTLKDHVEKCKSIFPDIEELPRLLTPAGHAGSKCCGDKTKCGTTACTSLPRSTRPLTSVVNGVTWVQAATLADIYVLQAQYTGKSIKLTVGNTTYGVDKNVYQVYVDITQVPDLQAISIDPVKGVTIGAAVRLTDVLNALQAYGASSSFPAYATARYAAMAAHMQKVAGTQVRNAGSWVGGVVLANTMPSFTSDMVTILAAANAQLSIGTSAGVTQTDVLSFLKMSLQGVVVISINIPLGVPGEVYRSFKVMQRFENTHAIVNAAFSAVVTNGTITGQPFIVYGGLNNQATRMPKTEASLVNQSATSAGVFQASLAILNNEVVINPAAGQVAYRTSLVQTLFYKYFLNLQPSLSAALITAINPPPRPVSDGIQTFQSVPNEFPASEPLPKLEARQQASGEIKYASDLSSLPGTLFAALVLSTVASGTIGSISATNALAAPGVSNLYTAADLTAAQNSWGPTLPDEQLMASSTVTYFGQILGMVIADTQAHADAAAELVQVTYSSISSTPLITVQDAITASSFYPPLPQAPIPSPLVYGNVAQGFASSAHVLTGSIQSGWQSHFGLEPHAVMCIPDENNTMRVQTAAQFTSFLQGSVAAMLGRNAMDVVIEPKKVGGSYGARITRNVPYSMLTAWVAAKLNVPVRMNVQFNSLITMLGKRPAYLTNYKIGIDANGKLLAIQLDTYINQGASFDGANFEAASFIGNVDNAYYCPNWQITATLCKTNTPPCTSMRGPGWTQAVFVSEQLLEHVSAFLNQPSDVIKAMNLYTQGQVTPSGQTLQYFSLPTMIPQIKFTSEYTAREQTIAAWNASNRWLKKGISMNLCKFGVYWTGSTFGANIVILADGSVVMTHSGIEIGQGINTKVAQAAAMMLGIPMSSITVQDSTTTQMPNASPTGGSIATGLNAMAVLSACETINTKLAPFRQPNQTWQQLIGAALAVGTDLTARGWANPGPSPTGPEQYQSYGVCVAETQVDILTGEVQIPRVDILFDLGVSMNPFIDIGQVEGAFMQGLGLHMFEQILYDDVTNPGALITNGTWEYKPPGHKDIPIDLRVSLLKNAPNPYGVLRSKAIGEPPLSLGCTPFFAAKHAIAAALSDAGITGYFPLDSPGTSEALQLAAAPVASQFVLS